MPLTAPYKLSNLHYITLHYITTTPCPIKKGATDFLAVTFTNIKKYIKISKICLTLFLRTGTQFMCAKFRENQRKTAEGGAIEKN